MAKAQKMRVHLYPEPCDMRLGFAGLHRLVRDHFGSDASTGHSYAFINKARNRVKVLSWDGTGILITAKRLEKGTFAIPPRRLDLPEYEILNSVDPSAQRPHPAGDGLPISSGFRQRAGAGSSHATLAQVSLVRSRGTYAANCFR